MLNILYLLVIVYSVSADYYIPYSACLSANGGSSKNSINSCEILEEEKCEGITYFEENQNSSLVLLSASFQKGPLNYVYFNATLLEEDWETFRIHIYSSDAKLSECRLYKNTMKAQGRTNFGLVLMPEKYDRLEKKAISLQYEIKKKGEDKSQHGRLIFIAPTFKRFANPPSYTLEVFSYIDNTEKEILKLHIQPAEEKYKVPNYDVEVWKSVDTRVKKVSAPFNEHGEAYYAYNATNKKGTYFFVVMPNITACGKPLKIKSAVIDLDPNYTLTAIILYSVILVIFLVCGTFICFRRECECCP